MPANAQSLCIVAVEQRDQQNPVSTNDSGVNIYVPQLLLGAYRFVVPPSVTERHIPTGLAARLLSIGAPSETPCLAA